MLTTYDFLPGQPPNLPDIFDGFTLSLSLPLLPMSFRVHAMAQMEVLRRAKGYRLGMWSAPSMAEPTVGSATPAQTVPSYGQIEEQWSVPAGSYLWGWMFSTLTGENANFHVQITDACTEMPLFSDYVSAVCFAPGSAPVRGPGLLTGARLVSDPGKVNVEIYNNSNVDGQVQFVGYFAVPIPLPPGLMERVG